MLIKSFDVINIHHGDNDQREVWVKGEGQEMALDESLHDLPEIIDMMRMARTNPGLQDCLDRAKIMYRLSKK